MYRDLGNTITGCLEASFKVFGFLYFLWWLTIPLAIWKLIDIGAWLYHHVNVSVS